jgi:hypothetical protein
MRNITLVSLLFLASCTSSGSDNAKSLLDRLEFDEDETGCVRIQSDLKLGGNPFVGNDTSLVYHKSKGENSPQC